MKPRFVKLLIGLYPRGWRARYGEEFRTLLEEQPTTLGGLTNIIRCALSERLRLAGGHLMKDVKSSLMLFLFAGVATLAAGANLYFIVDDTPLAAAMQAHSALAACWLAMAAGSVLAIAGVAVASVPVLWAMARFAGIISKRSAWSVHQGLGTLQSVMNPSCRMYLPSVFSAHAPWK